MAQETENPDNKSTILIVDDEPLNVLLLDLILREAGYRILKAKSGPEGRKLAVEESPSLILLDIMMPGEDGIATCRILKADPRTADIPVIFLSALSGSDYKVSGFENGAVDYIIKPFEKDDVMARVQLHLRMREHYLALARKHDQIHSQLRKAQEGILVAPDEIPEARFAVYYRAVNSAGGDFYDVVEIGPGIHGYFVADISGHDLKASFIISAIKALFRQNAAGAATPEETMQAINKGIIPLFKDGMHLTACYFQIDRVSGMMTLISGGHLPVIHISGDGTTDLVTTEGDILGIFDPVTFFAENRKTETGGRFFAYTDGMVENAATLFNREEGIFALQRACRETLSFPLEQAVTAICARIYGEGSSPEDDVVLMAVEV